MKVFKRWKVISIIVSCALAMACGFVSCGDDEEAEPDYGILLAVPSDAGIVVKANDLCELCTALSNECQIWTQISTLPRLKEAAKVIKILDTTAQNNPSIRNVLHGKSAMVSFHKLANKVSALIGVKISPQDHKTLMDYILSVAHNKRCELQKFTYDKTSIYAVVELLKDSQKEHFFMAYTGGYFMASTSRLTVEQAVRHIHGDNKHGMKQDKALKKLLCSANQNAKATLIFNHKQLSDMYAADITASSAKYLSSFANWSVLDISTQKQVVSCAGFTDNSKPSQMLSIIKSQKPITNSCHEYLPSKTPSFVSLGISDMHLFENDFKNHKQATGKFADYETNNDRIRKSYSINFPEFLYTNLKSPITEFSCTYSLANRGNDHYIIAELNDAEKFEIEAADLCKTFRQKEKIADKDGVIVIKTSKGNKYTAYKFPVLHTFNSYFGDMFSTESRFMMIYQEKAVFGTSIESLYEYANSIDNGRTLANNSIYDNFSKYVNEESNIYFYIDIAYSQEEIRKCVSEKIADELKNNASKLHNIRSFALQYSHHKDYKDLSYTNATLMYSASTEAERLVSWIAQTDTTLRGKPQIVSVHESDDKDIIVQDETFRLYLFDKNGKREFAKQIGEPLTSQIYQIDVYDNHKKQYVFATEHFIHALDRKGNYLNNFPIQLPAKVSTEITVYDYDNTHDYRIFVPCSDRKLYVYTKEGVQLDTWTPLRTNDPIITPVQFFRIYDNDYLVFADHLKTYIVNRRGEVRINVTNNFPKANNSLYYLEAGDGVETRFVTTNSAGEIKYIYTDGSCKSKTFKNLSADHHFALKDLDGDGENEYIFTDQNMLYVFRSNGTEKFSYCFDGTIGRPNFFKFNANDVRIGVTCKSEKQLFLFSNKGQMCRGFPLQGTSEFSITKLSKNSKFSLLAGNSDNYLYNYIIQ